MKIKLDYGKLILLLYNRKLKLTNVCKEVGLSSNITTSINNGKSINLDSAAKIALHLGIGLDDIVSFNEITSDK